MTTCLDEINVTLAAIQAALESALPDTGWLAWESPVISQPAALTLSSIPLADYRVANGVLDARLNVVIGSAGTSGQKIVLSGLPVQPADNTVGQPLCFGFVIFSGTFYGATGTPDGAGNILLPWMGSGGFLGENPTVGLAVNDSIYLNLRYRVEVV